MDEIFFNFLFFLMKTLLSVFFNHKQIIFNVELMKINYYGYFLHYLL